MIEAVGHSLLGPIFNSYVIDAIAVYNSNGQQVFTNARPMKVARKPDSKLMEHPLENGASIVDHRILLPPEIELSLVTKGGNYRDVYEQIQQLFINGESLRVQTNAGVFDNYIIASMPHEESPDFFDSLVIALKLKNIQFATTQVTFVPKNTNQQTTVNRGNQQSTPANPQQEQKAGSWAGSFNLLGV